MSDDAKTDLPVQNTAAVLQHQAARDAALSHVLYGDTQPIVSTYLPVLRPSLDSLRDATGMTAADAERHVTEMALAFDDAGIGTDEAASIHSHIVHHLNTPVDDATYQEWQTEARRMVREQYGSDADRRLQAATAFVKSRPAFARALEESGIGSHPKLVLALVERANHLKPPRKRS